MAQNTLPLFDGAGKFYVYVYRDPRQGKKLRPIYVGKGTAAHGRADVHLKSGARNLILRRLIAKIAKAGLEPVVEIVGWFDIEADALNLEISLIKKFGRLDQRTGTLANLTDGGDGISGLSADALLKKSQSHKRLWQSDEYRTKMASIIKERWGNEDFKQRMSAIQKAVRSTEEYKAKRSETSKMVWSDPKTYEKIVSSIRSAYAKPGGKDNLIAALRDEDYRKRRSEIAKAIWQDPDKRKNILNARKGKPRAFNGRVDISDEHRGSLSAASKSAWADPEKRARIMEGRRKAKEERGRP